MKKVRDKYKMTELGEIPSEWHIEVLGECSNVTKLAGFEFTEYIEYIDDGEIIALRALNLKNGKLNLEDIKKIDKKVSESLTRSKLYINDVLFSYVGTVGEVALIEENDKFHLAPNVAKLTFNDSVVPKFALQYLMSSNMRNEINRYVTTTSQPALSMENIRKLKIIVPKKEEQEKISFILSTVDEQIDNVDALIEKNKELKKGLMQTLFTKGIGHTKFKNTEIGEIPEEWDVKKIGDICEVKGGKRLPKGYQLEDEDNAFPYIRVADMYMGGIRQDDIKYVPKDIVDKIKNYKISKDDLFISVAGTLGIVGQVPYELDGANLTENADKLCNIQINKLYLMKVLQSNIVQSIIEAEQTKSAQPKLALTRIKEFLIPVPSDIEQVKIASILMEVDEKIGQYKNKKQKLEELKKGLMQQLLTGMIRVTV
ncbi:restriction endonuclease subunit S [Clostridium sp. CAG:265]|uniref:restriction endonuclease subunit S n=1 Tax=Clostridium sp. CAG:265 TaxID=1262787 RepID=UPI0003355CA7|nr:restriction endonuclease subunit S [Clostridium sp. CAG:265]CDB74853.1 type I restriction-modification system S subunit EcoA family protein [Clostridium sp. CAG:265]